MSPAHVFIAIMILLDCVGLVANMSIIGKPRKPLTHGTAIVVLIITVMQVSALFYIAHQVS